MPDLPPNFFAKEIASAVRKPLKVEMETKN